MDLTNPNYEDVIDRMLTLKNTLKKNLEGFTYQPELNKWYEIFK